MSSDQERPLNDLGSTIEIPRRKLFWGLLFTMTCAGIGQSEAAPFRPVFKLMEGIGKGLQEGIQGRPQRRSRSYSAPRASASRPSRRKSASAPAPAAPKTSTQKFDD